MLQNLSDLCSVASGETRIEDLPSKRKSRANEENIAATVSAMQTLIQSPIKDSQSPTNVKTQHPTRKLAKFETINR
jgi:hypothetical protein